ncbi:MAG: type II toxin-antitoxin system RelE/ParE family toxin [Mesorhizobium sp.]
MVDALASLASFPDLGRNIARLSVPGARRLVVGDYVIEYDLSADAVYVLAIRHGRQIGEDPEMDGDMDFEEPSH